MQQLGQYVLSLTAVAIICGILLSMFRDGTMRNLLRMLSGIVLTMIALSPLTDLRISDSFLFSESYHSEGKAIATMGEDLAESEKERCIQRQLEAYILDKADALNAQLTAVVKLNEDCLPVEVRLDGECSASVRQTLSAMITNDLGIPEEDQKWTGEM